VTCDIPVYLAVNYDSAFIYERDVDFGDVVVPETTYPTPDYKRPSEKIDESKLSHLQPWQREELLNLLDDYSEYFFRYPRFLLTSGA